MFNQYYSDLCGRNSGSSLMLLILGRSKRYSHGHCAFSADATVMNVLKLKYEKGYAYFNTHKYGTTVTRMITVIDILMNPQKHNLCKNSLHNLGSGSISHTQVTV